MLSSGFFSGLSSVSGNLLTLYKMRQDGSYEQQQKLLHSLREVEAENAQQRALQRDGQNSQERVTEAAIANTYEVDRDWRQAYIGIRVKQIQDRLDRQIEESPFSGTPDDFYNLVYEATHGGRTPALLIAPFFRDDLSGQENDEGPHSFRVTMRRTWLRSRWAQDLVSLDGALNRPLRNTDLDIFIIQRALRELPVVLVYGEVQSNHRAWPSLCAWNIVDSPELRSLQVNFPPLALPNMVGNNGESDSAAQVAFEDELGDSTAITAGLIAEWFHLVRLGRIPRLHTMLPETMGAEKRVIAAGLAASFEVAIERNRVDLVSGKIGQARVYMETGMRECAENAAHVALSALESNFNEACNIVSADTMREMVSIFSTLQMSDEENRAKLGLEAVAQNAIMTNLGWGS